MTEREQVDMAAEAGAVEVLNPSVLGVLTKAELDQAIATAKAYPRSTTRFHRELQDMTTLSGTVAEECVYTLQRRGAGGKMVDIIGPTVRFAEAVASAWGNCRAAARVVDDTGDYIRAQGVFMDLERNVTVSFEVQRRVTDASGRRYSPDMVGVTANAASAVALRNAVLRGVPKVFWCAAWDEVQAVIKGDASTLEARRKDALAWLAKKGISEARVLAALDVAGLDDIGLDELLTLKGLITSVREGQQQPEVAFPTPAKAEPAGTAGVKAKLGKKAAAAAAEEPAVASS